MAYEFAFYVRRDLRTAFTGKAVADVVAEQTPKSDSDHDHERPADGASDDSSEHEAQDSTDTLFHHRLPTGCCFVLSLFVQHPVLD